MSDIRKWIEGAMEGGLRGLGLRAMSGGGFGLVAGAALVVFRSAISRLPEDRIANKIVIVPVVMAGFGIFFGATYGAIHGTVAGVAKMVRLERSSRRLREYEGDE